MNSKSKTEIIGFSPDIFNLVLLVRKTIDGQPNRQYTFLRLPIPDTPTEINWQTNLNETSLFTKFDFFELLEYITVPSDLLTDTCLSIWREYSQSEILADIKKQSLSDTPVTPKDFEDMTTKLVDLARDASDKVRRSKER